MDFIMKGTLQKVGFWICLYWKWKGVREVTNLLKCLQIPLSKPFQFNIFAHTNYCTHLSYIWRCNTVIKLSKFLQIKEKLKVQSWSIILGKQYTSYPAALVSLGLERLEVRREALSRKFAKKALKSNKYSSWFVEDTNPLNTRRQIKTVKEAQCRTKRLQKSALPYLTHILNIDKKWYYQLLNHPIVHRRCI